jgi:hypothetical protein
MRTLTVLITVFMVGFLAGSASAMVVHWTESTPYQEIVAWPGTQGNATPLTFNNMVDADRVGAFQAWDQYNPRFASQLYRGSESPWSEVVDLNNEYIVGRLGDAHDISPSAIPEPGTMLLLGIGMIGTSLAARRRRKS